MITKEESIAKFKEILATKNSWKALGKSQFINHLAVFMSWCLRSALWAVERARQEFFLSTALNDSSVMSFAEDREYIPRKKTPSTGSVTITNNGPLPIFLPSGQVMSSETGTDYSTDAAITIAAAGTGTVDVTQKSILEVVHTVTEEKSFYEILFDEDLDADLTAENAAKICDFDVYVDLGEGDGYEEWTYSRLFQNSYGGDHAYDEFYSHAGKMGVRFGNEYVGTVLPASALVKLTLYLTEGDITLASGQPLYLVGEVLDSAGLAADLAMVTAEAITDGQDAEGIPEMQQNLRYWPIYNEKLVWRDDYIFFIKRSVANILWIKVWGEEEAEAAYGADVLYINKIFISAYATDRADLDDEIMARLDEVEILNRKFEWVAPEFSTFHLTVTGKVPSSVVITDAQSAIEDALEANYGKDSAARKDIVLVKDFYRIINGTGYFDGMGAYFEVTVAGTTEATGLNEMVHIDMTTTTVTLTSL